MLKPSLCLATNNPHKIFEIEQIVGEFFEFKSLAQVGCHIELPEEGDTIEANSYMKAMFVHKHFGVESLADDSGLEVEALGGAPGVDSAHFSGSRDSAQNIKKVLDLMRHQSHRAARFKTVLTLVRFDAVYVFEGVVEGKILQEPRGEGGFGYDPIFVPNGYDLTFAELSALEKNKISHRAAALKKFLEFCHAG
jgi:XTP/dITP diphosphohydrolase